VEWLSQNRFWLALLVGVMWLFARGSHGTSGGGARPIHLSARSWRV